MSSVSLRYDLILASGSPRRRELLSEMGVPYRVEAADCEELSRSDTLSCCQIAMANALAKAKAVAGKNVDSLVLGADTVVVCGGRLFGKPATEDEAVEMLRSLSGKVHEVITGVALCCGADAIQEVFAVTTLVTFKFLSDEVIFSYMQQVPVMDKAGAYAIQDHGEMIVEKIDGSLSNVIGLPVEELTSRLKKYS